VDEGLYIYILGNCTESYGFPATSPGGRGLVGSIAPGIGALNPLKRLAGGIPSGNGYPEILYIFC